MSEVVVLSAPEVEPQLCQWLNAAGYTALPWREAAVAFPGPEEGAGSGNATAESAVWRMLPDHGTLISYFPDPETTEARITSSLLARLPVASIWIQLGPMVLGRALLLAARAREVQVTYLHAPYLQPPERVDRPRAVVYGPEAVTGRGRTDTLIRALSAHAEWVGPLESSEPSGHEGELTGLADHALAQFADHDGRS